VCCCTTGTGLLIASAPLPSRTRQVCVEYKTLRNFRSRGAILITVRVRESNLLSAFYCFPPFQVDLHIADEA
jgi:hypothetical protein